MTAMPASDRLALAPTEPRARAYDQIARAVAYIAEHQRAQPELDEIARQAGMSPHHFQRVFSDWVGISPKKFLKAVTLEDAKARLRDSVSVLDAAFDAGLSGPGRLHDLFVTTDAVTPGEYKSRGDGMEFRYGFHPSPFGECLVVASERGLTGLAFSDGNRDPVLAHQQKGWERAEWVEDAAATRAFAEQAFGAPSAGSAQELRLLMRGSPFRVKVWEALLKVPPGAVISYGDLAARLGQPTAARAVAGANANNLIGYVIPCHRVIRETGALAGYRWGEVRKNVMLGLEAVQAAETGLESRA